MAEAATITDTGQADGLGITFTDLPADKAAMARYEAYLALQARAGELTDAEYLAELDSILEEGDDFENAAGNYAATGSGAPPQEITDSTEDDLPGEDGRKRGNGLLQRGMAMGAANGRIVTDDGVTTGNGPIITDDGTIVEDGPTVTDDGVTTGNGPIITDDGTTVEDGPTVTEDGATAGNGPTVTEDSVTAENGHIITDDGVTVEDGPTVTEDGVTVEDGPTVTEDGATAGNGGTATEGGSQEEAALAAAAYAPANGSHAPGVDGTEFTENPDGGPERGSVTNGLDGPPVTGTGPMVPGDGDEYGTRPGSMTVPGHVEIHKEAFEVTDFLDEMSVATGLAQHVQTAEYVPPAEIPLDGGPPKESGQQYGRSDLAKKVIAMDEAKYREPDVPEAPSVSYP